MDKNISKTKPKIFDIILIGSGPSAVAALSSIDPELKVLVVDKCVKPSHKVDELKNQIGIELMKKKTIVETVNFLFKTEKKILQSDFIKKKYWGSDYVYGELQRNSPNFSQAYGGFSKIWGATCFPYTNSDLSKMEKQFRSEILIHIEKMEKLIDVEHSGFTSKIYPNTSTYNVEERSSLIERLIQISNHKTISGFNFEPSRLAISNKNQIKTKFESVGCLSCGLCQVGCPVNFMWDSTNDFETYVNLLKAELVVGNVTKFEESEDFISVVVENLNEKYVYFAKKLLLTGGVKSSSELLVNSKIYDEIKVFDSQTNLVCIWSFKKISLQKSQFSFTDLSIHFEMNDIQSHIQLYRMNDYFIHRIRENYFLFKFLPLTFFRFLSLHVIFGFSYFPQEVSGEFMYSKGRWAKNRNANFKAMKKIFKAEARKLFKIGLLLFPIQIKLPTGSGNHIGGQFYLEKSWTSLKSDLDWREIDGFGRPCNLTRVHICDGLAFGPIPVGSVTLTSMANTSRIVSKIMKLTT